MSVKQWNGSRDIITLKNMAVEELDTVGITSESINSSLIGVSEDISCNTITFGDATEQTTAFIPNTLPMNLFGVQLLNITNPPVNIYCSIGDFQKIGNQNDQDMAWLIFPNWSCILYQETDYVTLPSLRSSQLLTNTTNQPLAYYSVGVDNVYDLCIPIIDSSGDDSYPQKVTRSIRVYYNGVEVIVSGLS
jgi:hypothetical protein